MLITILATIVKYKNNVSKEERVDYILSMLDCFSCKNNSILNSESSLALNITALVEQQVNMNIENKWIFKLIKDRYGKNREIEIKNELKKKIKIILICYLISTVFFLFLLFLRGFDSGVGSGGLENLNVFGVFIYYFPFSSAYEDNHEDVFYIFLLNFFFGWTIVGWIIALKWSDNKILNE